jgi:hypothetical protein
MLSRRRWYVDLGPALQDRQTPSTSSIASFLRRDRLRSGQPDKGVDMVLRRLVISALIAATALASASIAAADPSQYLVRTQSGKLRCIIHTCHAACSPTGSLIFAQAPVGSGGSHDNVASVDSSRGFQLEWATADMPGNPANDTVLNYGQTYHLLGWTILPNSDGTRFTNDDTGHGMFVSIDNVYSF